MKKPKKKPIRKKKRRTAKLIGRPPEYKPEFVQIVSRLSENGATDAEIADSLDISIRTVYLWKAKYPEFLQACRMVKDIADDRVVRSLYSRSVGYEHDAVKLVGPFGLAVPYRAHVPPDVGAIQFWLKNRRPEEWRDRHEHNVSVSALKSADQLKQELLQFIQDNNLQDELADMLPMKVVEGGVVGDDE